jgi:hypothetical protein
MTSPVDLCNMALDQISARTSITGISPASPPNNIAAQVASRTYQTQSDAVFRAAHWNSARVQNPLTLLRAARGTPENPSGTTLPLPPIPWIYEYAYPSDCLAVRFVIPKHIPNSAVSNVPIMTNLGIHHRHQVNTAMPFVPAIDTDAGGNQVKVILTNARNADAVYTGRIANVDLWDASLKNAVIGTLAAWFCQPVSGNMELRKGAIAIAVGLVQSARLSDGNEGITTSDVPVDWMQVRNAGAGWGDGFSLGGPCVFGGWQALAMPDGVSY